MRAAVIKLHPAAQGRDWAAETGRATASNPYAVATTLAATPVPAPPG